MNFVSNHIQDCLLNNYGGKGDIFIIFIGPMTSGFPAILQRAGVMQFYAFVSSVGNNNNMSDIWNLYATALSIHSLFLRLKCE